MSTRSRIAVLNTDGTTESIYCHYDGYLSGVGACLLGHWNSETRIRELLTLGDLSILGETVGEQHSFDNRSDKDTTCLSYGRDRGEANVSSVTNSSVKELKKLNSCEEFLYIYSVSKSQWYYCTYHGLRLVKLTPRVCGIKPSPQ